MHAASGRHRLLEDLLRLWSDQQADMAALAAMPTFCGLARGSRLAAPAAQPAAAMSRSGEWVCWPPGANAWGLGVAPPLTTAPRSWPAQQAPCSGCV